MFLFLFVGIIESAFVPFADDYDAFNYIFDESQFNSFVSSRNKVIAIGMNSKHRAVKIIPTTYRILHDAYFDQCDFVQISEEFTLKISKELNLNLPIVLLFDNGRNIAIFEYPEQESSFIKLVQIFIESKLEKISTSEELYDNLGESPYALLVSEENYEKAKLIHYNVSTKIGMTDILIVDQQILDNLSISTGIGLFRNEDSYLIEIEPNVNSFLRNSRKNQNFRKSDTNY
ncbi:hypothetical protein TVAG_073480 [Trichomonas vaginalis G3]|uniref:Thioredoxin domain-containing protein n=1 Tax=Trichomonas vaginalis (strain ATCC PRA-98 / G3) TaxID=412133 RepID=A2GU12_TRIV3|nr:intramolecular oxidoreductase activity, transposing S-S bonds [Trichomonas vaginalis G3]EAX79355.1 hypothetical protein TVAG_073480 [Trichomonas vaginalis G3]KAI5538407.1 intramolecular oxidoreductase activity, transposing S-S bonds [Trichomonas vaginalis G3]|eukprot:XP_001292285.1 hypothetical protein [Trichomonas vaginalis G3]